ncbi:carcinoembryonic antigen-related cell adhesion molecule 5-like [Argopecten irradians]|uniref:carcinoembryonic antigen-related cell adhesion molecule 5-like n=1 Tax=Argopecten irradians TaxID=31199 RepID=UPI00371CB666
MEFVQNTLDQKIEHDAKGTYAEDTASNKQVRTDASKSNTTMAISQHGTNSPTKEPSVCMNRGSSADEPSRYKPSNNGSTDEVENSVKAYAAEGGVKVTMMRVIKFWNTDDPTYTARINVSEDSWHWILTFGPMAFSYANGRIVSTTDMEAAKVNGREGKIADLTINIHGDKVCYIGVVLIYPHREASYVEHSWGLPDGPPVISGYTSSSILYINDTLSLSCRQTGGNPLSTLTWTGVCGGISATDGSTGTESVSTIIIIVTKSYNQGTCGCVSTHPQPQGQNRSQVTFTVHYAPTKDPVLTGYTEGQILYEGSADLLLTCTQEGGNPLSTITWDCEGQTGTPGTGSSTEVTSNVQVPSDRNINRKSCTCTSRSPDTNITFQKSTTVVFTIYYSPLSTQLPSISGYTSGEVLYEEDPVRSIQCHQAGGFPLATLTWDCFGLSGNDMSTQSASVSTIQLSTNRDYNDRNCTCTASHPDINVIYRRSDYVTVTVHYPPSSPTVSQTPTHPWLEGESGTLNCSYTEGFPALTRVEWFRNGRLQTGQSSPSITLTSLTKDYNQAGYGCRVKNDFTDVKLTNLTSSVIYLNVEFRPLVTLTPTTLTVVEGQTAEVTCDTEGNPTPRVEWLRGGASVQTGQGTSLTLTLGDVDRSETDNYTCRAEGVSSVQGRQLITQRITPNCCPM